MNTNKYITTVVAYQESRVGCDPDKGSWLVSWMDTDMTDLGMHQTMSAIINMNTNKYEYECTKYKYI